MINQLHNTITTNTSLYKYNWQVYKFYNTVLKEYDNLLLVLRNCANSLYTEK